MRENKTIQDLGMTNRYIVEILSQKIKSPIDDDTLTLKVVYGPADFAGNDSKSWLYIIVDEEVIMNPIIFSCPIDNEDISNISLDMLEEFKKKCNFNESLLCPTHVNGFYKTEEKWKEKYCKGSEEHIKFVQNQISNLIGELNCCEDKKFKKDVKRKLIKQIKK